MMKKYVKPEIEALALETIDVIATSGDGYQLAADKLVEEYGISTVNSTQISQTLKDIKSNTWSW